MSNSNMIYFDTPDEEFLAVIGKLAVVHTQLVHMKKMTLRRLKGISVPEVLHQTKRHSSKRLREQIKKELGGSENLLKLEKLLEQEEQATQRRNEYIHSLIGKELDGDFLQQDESYQWKKLDIKKVKILVADIIKLRDEFVKELSKSDGFLFKVLPKTMKK